MLDRIASCEVAAEKWNGGMASFSPMTFRAILELKHFFQERFGSLRQLDEVVWRNGEIAVWATIIAG